MTDYTPSPFEMAKENLHGLTGFQRKLSTVAARGEKWLPQSSYIIETIRTDEGVKIFLEIVNDAGGQRLILPDKVVKAIYSQYESMNKTARKNRAKNAAQTRKVRGNDYLSNLAKQKAEISQ